MVITTLSCSALLRSTVIVHTYICMYSTVHIVQIVHFTFYVSLRHCCCLVVFLCFAFVPYLLCGCKPITRCVRVHIPYFLVDFHSGRYLMLLSGCQRSLHNYLLLDIGRLCKCKTHVSAPNRRTTPFYTKQENSYIKATTKLVVGKELCEK